MECGLFEYFCMSLGIAKLHYIMKSTKVQTLGACAYYRRQTRTRTATPRLLEHVLYSIYCSHAMQEVVYTCNGAVSEKSTQRF